MRRRVNFDAPANYWIEVQGSLQSDWYDRFGSMKVTTQLEEEDTFTTLKGRVSDQSELAGVLNTLYELHLTLISVQLQDEESAA